MIKVRKDNDAKAIKKNDATLKKLYEKKKKEQQNIASLSRAVAVKTPRVHVATPNTDSNNPAKAYTGNHLITRHENLPTKIVNPKVPRSKQNNATTFAYYGYQKTSADKTNKINGKLTENQQKEISNYALTLVNSYLKDQGLAPVRRSNSMDTNMKKLINRREKAKIGFNHTDWGFAEKTFTKKTGLDYSGENLGGILANDSTTLLELKVGVLNSITTMIYQDGYAKWGHRELFKKSAGKYVSAGIEQNRGHYSNWFRYMFVFGLAHQRGNVKVQPAAISFASTYRKHLAPSKETANLNAAKKRLADIDRQINSRNNVLDRNMKKQLAAHRAEFNKSKSAADKIMIAKLNKV
ncbi:SEC10/PgrA surface exclusion domain-containing protein [Weissella ceti]|uniref:SEC10/PgrA surface exclusion domain-containing protein n=1 Tax=Weissella ceti TaxID=759620 RepID=A0ABT3E4Z8_9LACO|nr:SEC10/PgrA surface exclusion domain-containing protein [Weissella ceti]MCW0953504.1 SEC10/PgrA surface exclusion domain-containing protein [Weissella ceti]QVK12091.1 SEC10/PgrA surface exclusion domain-containing protein [Weissella ceti]